MNLQENLKRIKEIMKLDEAETSQTSSQQFQNALSKLKSLSSISDINNFLLDMADSQPEGGKKLVMIFPQESWQVYLLRVIFNGDYAGVFSSASDAKEFLDKLISKGTKFDDVYFGSHGGGYEGLFYTLDDDANISINKSGVMSKLKQVVTSSSIVMFSACGGANNLYNLKWAAEDLGCVTYGSEGDFDWWNNKSEGTMWRCPYTPPLLQQSDYNNFDANVKKIGREAATKKFSDTIIQKAKTYCKVMGAPPFDFKPQYHYTVPPIIQNPNIDDQGRTPLDRERERNPGRREGGGQL